MQQNVSNRSFKNNFIVYFIFGCPGPSLWQRLLLWSLDSRWASFSSCSMPASVAVVPRLQSAGLIVVVHGLSCSTACGFILNQGLNSRPLHWQVETYPLCHQGSPQIEILWSLLIVSFIRNTRCCALKGTIYIISNCIPWSRITVILHSFTFSRILQYCFSHLLLFSM